MNRKIAALIMAAVLLCLAACGASGGESPPPAPSETLTPAPTQTPSEAPLPESEPNGALAWVTLTDAQALGIVTADYSGLPENLTASEAAALADAVYERYDAIGIGYSRTENLSVDPTVAELAGYVFQILSNTELPGGAVPSGDAADFLIEAGIYHGDITRQSASPATVDDAMLMLTRAVIYAANANNAGARGLVWELSDEDTTIYLLGSAHVDDAVIYPFDGQLMDILLTADAVALEVDFGDAEGMAYLQANAVYPDGDKLSNHISGQLMTQLLEIYAQFGVTEQSVLEQFRPWVLAGEILSLAIYAEGGELTAPMVMDMYVYYKAVEADIPVMQVESFQYQTDLFNGLEDVVLEEYLKSSIDVFNGEEPEGESSLGAIDSMLKAWRERDVQAFEDVYDKDEQEDAISAALFSERDKNMYEYVTALLEQSAGSYLVTVGAGHMIGESGIVARLTADGCEIRLLP